MLLSMFVSFLDNQAALGGGGLYCSKCEMKLLSQTVFARNNASLGGGGAMLFAPTDLGSLITPVIDLNSAMMSFKVAGVSFYDNAAMFAPSVVSSMFYLNVLYYLAIPYGLYCHSILILW